MVAGHLRIQNGIYQMILSYKDKQNKRKTKSISTHLPVKGNKKKAEAMLAKARKEFIPTLWDKDTDFSTFLSDWIELANFSPDTYADYYMCLNTYIVPYFDTVKRSITSITVNDLDTFYKDLQKNASIPTSESLKTTISLSHTIIKNGLLYAVKSGWIESNPADKLNPSTGDIEILFCDFILEWLEMMKSSVDLNTYAGYLSSAKSSIVPYFKEKGYTLRALKKSDSLKKELGFFPYWRYNRNIGKEGSEMLKDHSQLKLSLSPYQEIYDAVIPANHLLRKIKENIDFSFVNPMLRKQYCENFGRPAKEPEMMFKLLFLKKLFDLSDETLISSAQTDMAYKFFLDLEPEAKMIDPSLLTKFRKNRITEDILEELLKETIRQALDKGLIKSGTIIVDSTHTNASVRAKSPTQILRDMSKQLRKEIYKNAFDLSEKFPEKPSLEAGLEEEIAYTKNLLKALEEGIAACGSGKIQELAREMKELLEDEKIRDIRSKDDKDARFGHKTPTSTFYGYKNHLAMTEERLIAGISVTHGGAPDGQELPGLIEKVQETGIEVTEVIGDMAYVSDDNLEACGEGITLIARTNTAVAAAANGKLEEGFCYNKDAGMLQCPAGELAMRVEKRTAKNGNTYLRYVFSKVKCRKCPLRESCRVGRGKSKERSYSITQASEKNLERLKFEESEYFRERMKIRHRIEEKNGELKEAHGLRRADSRGLFAMELQMYITAFVANVKRITRLTEPVMQ